MAALELGKLATALKGQTSTAAYALRGQAERWWLQESSRQVGIYIAAAAGLWKQDPYTADHRLDTLSPYGPVAAGAYGMLHILALGGWQGRRVCEERRAAQGLRAEPGVALAANDWEKLNRELARLAREHPGADLPQWIVEQLKFPAAFARTFGIAPEYAAAYIAERIPSIVDASDELRLNVRDAVGRAGVEVWDPEQLQTELQQIGSWTTNRVHNQMRTEAGYMFTRGRMEAFSSDEAVTAYRFLVTVDERTTEICRAHIGLVIKATDLRSVPPFHYMCRTEIVPVFAWEKGAGGGDEQPPVMGGFGQPEYAATVRERHAGRPSAIPSTQPRPDVRLPELPTAPPKAPPVPRADAVVDGLRPVSAGEGEWAVDDLRREYEGWEQSYRGLMEGKGNLSDVEWEVAQRLAAKLEGDPSWPYEGVDEIRDLLWGWMDTSADSDARAIALQMAIRDEFGLQAAMTSHWDADAVAVAERHYAGHAAELRAFARAQYQVTQQWLGDRGIETVTLYRGEKARADVERLIDAAGGHGQVRMHNQPASSWATDPETAASFAGKGKSQGVVYAVQVPSERILGFNGTGLGEYNEREFVLLGGPGTARAALGGSVGDVVKMLASAISEVAP